MKRTLVIGDPQIRHGVPIKQLGWIGKLIASEQPDAVVCLGDYADQEAISKYLSPLEREGKRYVKDLDATKEATALLHAPWAKKAYTPKLLVTEGNHEARRKKYIAQHPEVEGLLPDPMDFLRERGWRVYPFLQPMRVHGVKYCHFFPRSTDGAIKQTRMGAANARLQALREMESVTAGHLQKFSYYEHGLGDRIVQSMIVGACYLHNEKYLSPQGNKHFRGVVMKTHTRANEYDYERISLEQLRKRYA